MTQQQMLQEFKTYPKAIKAVIIREMLQVFEKDLEEIEQNEHSVEERLAIVESLAGSLKMENPPMTREEERKIIEDYLMEKYS
jgi:hypothetical protein